MTANYRSRLGMEKKNATRRELALKVADQTNLADLDRERSDLLLGEKSSKHRQAVERTERDDCKIPATPGGPPPVNKKRGLDSAEGVEPPNELKLSSFEGKGRGEVQERGRRRGDN